MACNKQKFVGRDVALEYFIACGDELPGAADWVRLGSMRTKEFTLEWETTDATADDSVGSLRENLATFQSLTVSGDGTVKASGAGAQGLIDLTKHVANPALTDGQPVAWIRVTFPDLTFTAFMIVTNVSRSAPFDDVVTYSFSASATASDFGLIIDDTPDPSLPDVSTVTVTPATAALNVGDTQQLTVIVAPSGAFQSVSFTSSNPAVATVTPQGLIRAVSVGTSTIVARSAADYSKVDDCVVTVSA